MRKNSLFKQVVAVVLAGTLAFGNFIPTMAVDGGSTDEAGDTGGSTNVAVPNPDYFYDFEGETDDDKLQSKGLISGAETKAEIKGSGSLRTDESNNNGYFDNASESDLVHPGTQGSTDDEKRQIQQHYLNMPKEIINKIHYSENKAFTFSTKIKLVENKYSEWSPIFVIDDGNLDAWPNLALQFRGTATWNAAGWFNGNNDTKDDAIAKYSKTDWNTLTYVVTPTSIKAYINGELVQTITGTEDGEGCMKNLFDHGDHYFTTATRVSLGANQQVGWGDPDAQILYDDVAIYLSEFTEEQVKEITNNGIVPRMESVDIPESKLMVKEDKDTLIPVYTPASTAADKTNIQFSSSAPEVASVNETTGEVTAIAAGTADITVTVTTAYGSFQDTCKITVVDEIVNVESVSAKASFSTLYVGGAAARITSSYLPEVVTVDTTPSYQSSNTEILTVDSTGLVTGKKEGTATVTVTIDGKSADVPFQVKEKTSINGGWWTKFTPSYKVEDSSIVEFNLNVKGGDAAWNNFGAVFANMSVDGVEIPTVDTLPGYSEYAVVRGDNWGWGGGDNKSKSGNAIVYDGGIASTTPEDFIALMKSASVNIKIAKNGDIITYIYTAIGDNGKSITRTATITEDTGDALYVFFSPDTATIICDNIHNYILDTSAEGYQAPTCTVAGKGTFKCTDSDCEESIESSITATGHNLTKHEAEPATCVAAGKKAYWTCANEEGVFYADENAATKITEAELVIEATGHDLIKHEAVAATCTTAGKKAYWTCANEEGIFYADENASAKITEAELEVAATGHSPVKHEAVAATCVAAGKKEYWTCANEEGVLYANATLTETTTNEALDIEELGHDIQDAVYKDAAGNVLTSEQVAALKCTENATLSGSCSRCDYVAEGEEVTGTVHTYGTTGTVTAKATPETDGTIVYTCTACTEATEGHTKTDKINKVSDITLAATSYEYTGTAITPAVTVKDSESAVIDSANYDVAYNNNTEVGTGTVTVTFKGDIYSGTVEKTFTITEKKNDISITLKPTTLSLEEGASFTLEATILPADADKKVKWDSLNKEVAVVDENGKVTALKVGTAKIIVTSDADSTKSVSCDVTVTAKKTDNTGGTTVEEPALKLSITSATLYTGKDSKSVTVIAIPTGASKSVTWSSKNPKVATVLNGRITAVNAGKTEVTATANGITQKINVTVKNPTITIKQGKKVFKKSNLTVKKKKSVNLTISVKPAKSGISITKLTGKQKKIATVKFSSKTGKLTIKGKQKGKFTITIKSGKAAKKIKVTVK